MENALAQIGILAAGIAAGHVLIKGGSSAARRLKSAVHRPVAPDNYNSQTYYQPTERPSGYHQHRYPKNYYR